MRSTPPARLSTRCRPSAWRLRWPPPGDHPPERSRAMLQRHPTPASAAINAPLPIRSARPGIPRRRVARQPFDAPRSIHRAFARSRDGGPCPGPAPFTTPANPGMNPCLRWCLTRTSSSAPPAHDRASGAGRTADRPDRGWPRMPGKPSPGSRSRDQPMPALPHACGVRPASSRPHDNPSTSTGHLGQGNVGAHILLRNVQLPQHRRPMAAVIILAAGRKLIIR